MKEGDKAVIVRANNPENIGKEVTLVSTVEVGQVLPNGNKYQPLTPVPGPVWLVSCETDLTTLVAKDENSAWDVQTSNQACVPASHLMLKGNAG